jgi:outer membrane protein OmpA-like peptidoglycan-associated protein
MERAFPFETEEPAAAPRRAASSPTLALDQFKARADKKAARLARQERPAGVTGPAAAYYNPFAAKPREADLRPQVPSSRTMSNGAALQLVSSQAQAQPKPTKIEPLKEPVLAMFTAMPDKPKPPKAEKPVRLEKPKREKPAKPAKAATVAAAAAVVPAAGPAMGSSQKVSDKPKGDGGYWGGGGGGSGKGGGKDRSFDQDDVAGILIALGLLLLFLWTLMQSLGKTPAQPQAEPAAPTPVAKALPDPFGAGPVEMRPQAVREAAEAPPVPPVQVASVAEAPKPAPTPPAQNAAPVVGADAAGSMHVYFCTSRSSMSDAARDRFLTSIANWKTSAKNGEIVVTGYADTRGTNAFNTQLAENRADYLAGLLREQGLSVVEAVAVGELTDIEDEQNCQNQRRVDISFKADAQPSPSKACAPPPETVALGCA